MLPRFGVRGIEAGSVIDLKRFSSQAEEFVAIALSVSSYRLTKGERAEQAPAALEKGAFE